MVVRRRTSVSGTGPRSLSHPGTKGEGFIAPTYLGGSSDPLFPPRPRPIYLVLPKWPPTASAYGFTVRSGAVPGGADTPPSPGMTIPAAEAADWRPVLTGSAARPPGLCPRRDELMFFHGGLILIGHSPHLVSVR